MREHEIEPVPGLPEKLPDGEGILWQGSPNWWSLARRALYLRGLAIYFALMVTWSIATAISAGGPVLQMVTTSATSLGLALFCLGALTLVGRLTAGASLYTITNHRVVMRVGVALPMTINIPFTAIQSAAVRKFADGTEDIVLTLMPRDKVAWLALWPHARPWRIARAEPMLRAIPVIAGASQVLSRALAASAETQVAPLQDGKPSPSSGLQQAAVA